VTFVRPDPALRRRLAERFVVRAGGAIVKGLDPFP
jgi:hypothetical protein